MAQDTGKYCFTLQLGCGRQLPVIVDEFGVVNFDGHLEYHMHTIGGPQITFVITGYDTYLAAVAGIYGMVDVGGVYSAYITEFTVSEHGEDIEFYCKLWRDGEYPIYDYLMEVGA